jgi:hypothetical protein
MPSPLRKALTLLTSVPVLTLLILIGVDCWLRQGNPMDAMGFRTVDVWNLPERLKIAQQRTPDAIIIGSSLLLVLNQDENGKHLYSGGYPVYLQSLFRKDTGQPVELLNLCSGLQMVSESYLLTEAATSGRDCPPVVFYGLSLRDFIHDLYGKEWSCDSFSSMAPFVPVNWDVLSSLTSSDAVREFLFSHYWYLYRNRSDFKNALSAITKDQLENLPLDQSFVRLGEDHNYHAQRTGMLWETWVPRQQEAFTERMFRQHPEFLKKFYHGFQASIYVPGPEFEETQKREVHYFTKLLELCKRKQIRLVLVNMPLSPEISALAPPGMFTAYQQKLHEAAISSGTTLIDFFGDDAFKSDSFKDGVHLNYEGTTLLADKLNIVLTRDHPDILSAMAKHAALRTHNTAQLAGGAL